MIQLLLNNLILPNDVKVSCSIYSSKHTLILGANAVGKTSLIKSILGLNQVHKGMVLVDGKDIKNLDNVEKRKMFAYVPQLIDPPVYLSVFDFIKLGSVGNFWPFTFSRIEDSIENNAKKIMTELGILKLAQRTMGKLSGGELALVSIARALMQKSAFLFLDEAEAGLDFKHLKIYRKLISNLVEQGVGIVEVSHDPNYAISLSSSSQVVAFVDDTFKSFRPDELTGEILSKIYDLEITIESFNGLRVCK